MTSLFEGLLKLAKEAIVCDHWVAKDSTQLTIHLGDHINIIERTTDDWWYGECNEKYGYIPTNYIKLRFDAFIDLYHVQTRIKMERDPSAYEEEHTRCSVDYIQQHMTDDVDYFTGYNNVKIHHEMLSDVSRTQAYQNAVQRLQPYIAGKIVLDVGCGTGILSMFCAKAGAKHVYAVEASKFAFKTREIIAANKLNGKISVLHGKIEDIFLPVEQVDVIISEWMGTMLVTESMICSVLFARDHYLKGYIKPKYDTQRIQPRMKCSSSGDDDTDECSDSSDAKHNDDDDDDDEEDEDEIIVMDESEDTAPAQASKNVALPLQPPPLPTELMRNVMQTRGLMMPSDCRLYFGPIDLSQHLSTKIDYFNDVYGCDMTSLREDAIELYLAHATYDIEIDGANMLCAKPMVLKTYDMYTCTEDEDLINVESEFEFVLERDGVFCGFAGWFDVSFNPVQTEKGNTLDTIVLDTSPFSKRTHWSQTLFPLSEPIKVAKGDVVKGTLKFFRNNVRIRDYRMLVQCKVKSKVFRKLFFLWE